MITSANIFFLPQINRWDKCHQFYYDKCHQLFILFTKNQTPRKKTLTQVENVNTIGCLPVIKRYVDLRKIPTGKFKKFIRQIFKKKTNSFCQISRRFFNVKKSCSAKNQGPKFGNSSLAFTFSTYGTRNFFFRATLYYVYRKRSIQTQIQNATQWNLKKNMQSLDPTQKLKAKYFNRSRSFHTPFPFWNQTVNQFA